MSCCYKVVTNLTMYHILSLLSVVLICNDDNYGGRHDNMMQLTCQKTDSKQSRHQDVVDCSRITPKHHHVINGWH